MKGCRGISTRSSRHILYPLDSIVGRTKPPKRLEVLIAQSRRFSKFVIIGQRKPLCHNAQTRLLSTFAKAR